MLNLNLQGVEIFIKKSQSEKLNSFWENYDLLIWNKNTNGYTSKNGMFRMNSWGTAERIVVNEDGVWKLPIKYVKYFK
jgi:hypothetical protein